MQRLVTPGSRYLKLISQIPDGVLSQAQAPLCILAAVPKAALALHLVGCLLHLPLTLLQLPFQACTGCLLCFKLCLQLPHLQARMSVCDCTCGMSAACFAVCCPSISLVH